MGYLLNPNCTCRLSRQPSDRRGRYQLGRKKERKTISDPFPTNQQLETREFTHARRTLRSNSGEPKRRGSTPESWPLTPFRSGFQGAVSQNSVDATTRAPPLSNLNALRGCLWYATALSTKACLLLIQGSLAKYTIASALFCCAHARSQLTPLILAKHQAEVVQIVQVPRSRRSSRRSFAIFGLLLRGLFGRFA